MSKINPESAYKVECKTGPKIKLTNQTRCLVCQKIFYGHVTGSCLSCRKKSCADCGRSYEPKPVGRKVCVKCWKKRVRGE